MNIKKERNASVELLRCVLMFLIVYWHCYYTGALQGESFQGLWSLLFVFLPWHVDCFASISGWYGIKFKPSKVLRVWGQVAFYSVLSMAYVYFCKHSFKVIVNGGWFANSYLMLMFFAPILNGGIRSMAEKSRAALMGAWLVLAVGVLIAKQPYLNLITSVRPSGCGSISFFTLLFVYVSARVLKELRFNPSGRFVGLTFGFYCLMCAILGTMCVAYRYYRGYMVYGFNFCWCSEYLAPHVWAMAIVVCAYMAMRVHVGGQFARFIRFLSPSMFGVYLFHNDGTAFGRMTYCNPELWLNAHTELHPFFSITIVAICLFVVCVMVDMVRRIICLVAAPFLNWILDKTDACYRKILVRYGLSDIEV